TRPTIGFYALMATGFYNSISRIPCHPMAWSKVFLGWVEPTVVTGNWDNIVLQATELWGEGIKVIKVPVSSTEYFLLENRLRDENFNNVFDYNESGGNFFPDVMLDEYRFPDGSFAEFDWSLPNVLGEGMPAEIGEEEAARLGSGVLIWHIDEEVIRRNMNEDLTMNWVNTEPYHLGIDLEEADGIEHLLETLPASLDPGFGSPFDVYGGGVQGLKSLELENLNLLFGVHTNPSTVSYTGVASNIEIGGFRSMTIAPGEPVVDSLLGIDIRFNAVPEGAHLAHPLAGWPRVLGTGTSGSSPLVIDLDLARKGLDVVQVTDDGRVYLARGADGSGSFVAAASDSVHGSPAAGDIDGDGLLDVVVAAADGSVWAWKLEEDKPFLDPVPGWPVNLPGTFKAAPVLADLNGDGALEVVIGSCNGRAGSQLFALKGDGSYLAEFPVNLDHEAPAAAAVLLSGTGVAEAIYTGTLSGSLYSFDREGRKIFQRDLGAPLKASPVVGLMGLPGEGESYRVCAFTSGGRIWCLDTEGNIADGWPLETGGRCLAGGAV
ncbi:MAG: FG-GAP-like repeat-containing protein, partial [Gemmatimonadota bacterium]|nr:FG-GAP-like repeat-containing protein [Gemmatimonadota bacterium]